MFFDFKSIKNWFARFLISAVFVSLQGSSLVEVKKSHGTHLLVAGSSAQVGPSTKFVVNKTEAFEGAPAKFTFRSMMDPSPGYLSAKKGLPAVVRHSDDSVVDDEDLRTWMIGNESEGLDVIFFKNLATGGFLSCRELSDQKDPLEIGFSLRLDPDFKFEYDSFGFKKRRYKILGAWETVPEHQSFKLGRYTRLEDSPGLKELIGNMCSSDLYQANVHIKRWNESMLGWQDKSVKDASQIFSMRRDEDDPKKTRGLKRYELKELLLLIAKCNRYAMDAYFRGDEQESQLFFDCVDAASKEADKALERTIDPSLAYKDKHKSKAQGKIPLKYGDFVKIVSTKTWKHLFGVDSPSRHFNFGGASGLDENQGVVVCSTDYDDWNDRFELDENESWWIIKGPGFEGSKVTSDPFGVKNFGEPVKNSDIIRLENLRSGKHIHTSLNPLSGISPSWENYKHLSMFKLDGRKNTGENWVISVDSPDEKDSQVYLGSKFRLSSPGSNPVELATGPETNFYFPEGSETVDNTIEYVFAKTVVFDSDDAPTSDNYWAVESYVEGLWPTNGVIWTGNPETGQETEGLENEREKLLAKLSVTFHNGSELDTGSIISFHSLKGKVAEPKTVERPAEPEASMEETLKRDFAQRLHLRKPSSGMISGLQSALSSWASGITGSNAANALTGGYAKAVGDYFFGQTQGEPKVFVHFDPGAWIPSQANGVVLSRNTVIDRAWKDALFGLSSDLYAQNRNFKIVGGGELDNELPISRSTSNAYTLPETLTLSAKANSMRPALRATKDTGAIGTLDSMAERLEGEASRNLNELKEVQKRLANNVTYGDLVNLFNVKTLRNLVGLKQPSTAFSIVGSANGGSVVCMTNYDYRIDNFGINPLQFWWVIKGPHSSTDFFGTKDGSEVLNQLVRSGDVVRLEHFATAKNLHSTRTSIPKNSLYSGTDKIVSLYGNQGIGDLEDEWIILVEGKEKGDPFYPGDKFTLKSVKNECILGSDFDTLGFIPEQDKRPENSVEYAVGMDSGSGKQASSDALWTIIDFKQNWWTNAEPKVVSLAE